MTKEAVIFDLDGTLSDRRHRLHFVEQSKDWKNFFEKMSDDPPVKSVISELFKYHDLDYKIIILSGRPEDYRKQTIDWLFRNLIFPDMYELFMRESKNYETDVDLKERIYESKLKSYNIVKVFEDQKKLIDMWEEKGLSVVNCSLD